MADEPTLKVCILGDVGVGKSNLLNVYLRNMFRDRHDPTNGVDFEFKRISTDKGNLSLQIWDISGDDSYSDSYRLYLKNTVCFILVFDVTSLTSFESLDKWLQFINDNIDMDSPIILVGNKIDMKDERVIHSRDVTEYMEGKKGIKGYMEVSCRNGTNIKRLFNFIVNTMIDKLHKEHIARQFDEESFDSFGDDVSLSGRGPGHSNDCVKCVDCGCNNSCDIL